MDRSPLLDLQRAAGARVAERPEAPGLLAPLTFGDVPGEVRAVQHGAALLDAADRGRVRVLGKDAASFLHRLLANDVHGLGPGAGNRNLLLSPKGKVRFDFDLAVDEPGFALGAQPGRAAALLAALDMYLFNDDVRLSDETAETAPLELAGPRAAAAAEAVLGAAPPSVPHAFRDLAWGGGRVRATPLAVAGGPGLRLDGGPRLAPELWEALRAAGATPAGVVARDFARIERGVALTGVDVSEDVYPEEAGLMDAFSLTKGCYIGQEVVAKIDTYGGLNKRLLVLRVSHDDPVAAGTRLLLTEGAEERDLGVVTSWGYSFALDGGLVLAYVKRRHQEPGTTFRLGDSGATATVVAPPSR
jgi:aminomethyltransferase